MRRLAAATALTCGLALVASPAAALNWGPCPEKALKGLQCATLNVPKDYSDASKGSFDLAVARAQATGPKSTRKGSLFFNPGGPGVSGVSTLPDVTTVLPKRLRQRFDIVTWDPRGVGRSSGLMDCRGGTYTLPATGPVDWRAVADVMRSSEAAANRDCATRHPDVVPFISTVNTARDLNALRMAVGDRALTYWGTSYGTRIGAAYAQLFPKKVRTMLLSSPVAPNATWTSFAMGAGVAPDNAVGFFFETAPRTARTYTRVIRALERSPLTLPSGARITHWDIQALVATSIISQEGYATAEDIIAVTGEALNGSRKARVQLDRLPWPTEYPINGGATAFIGCLDLPQRFTPEEQRTLAERLRSDAPVFGFGTSQALYYCEGVDVPADPMPSALLNPSTPMLIMASTRDALTSFEWATDMARTFRNSKVVSYVGTTHTAVFTSGSTCLDKRATAYLLHRTRPATDVACPTTAR